MESPVSSSGAATAGREGTATAHRAPAAVSPHMSAPVVLGVPAPAPRVPRSAGDPLQPHAESAPRPRRGAWEALGPSRRETTPVRAYAYQCLKSLVLSGRFAPGERLAEERLSVDLGISRTPIREALHKLQSEGLITSLPTRGFTAPHDSQTDTEEIIDLRAVLEGYALRVICGRLTEHQLRVLERIVRRTEDAVASQRLCDISRWNARFHNALHALIGDKRRIYRQLVTMRQYALRYNADTQPGLDAGRRTAEGHRRILTALRLRDPDLCECAMREHIRRSSGDGPRREREPL